MSEASEVFAVRIPYTIKYTTEYPVPIVEIVDSLQSLEKLLKRTPAFLEKAYEGVKVLETNVFVEKIEAGSLKQWFCVEYIFGGAENYEASKQLAGKIAKDSKPVNTVIAVGMGVLIGAGAALALKSSHPTQPQHHLEAYNSVILNAGADINLTPEDLQEVVAGISDKKTLAREAVSAIRPAKADGESTIEFEGHAELTIPIEMIAEVPEYYEPPLPLERTVNYARIVVMVAASDKDRHSGGWAGSVPGITDSRKPFVLDESIEPSEVHGRTRITADVIVHERFVKTKKEYQVHSVEIVKVYPPTQ